MSARYAYAAFARTAGDDTIHTLRHTLPHTHTHTYVYTYWHSLSHMRRAVILKYSDEIDDEKS